MNTMFIFVDLEDALGKDLEKGVATLTTGLEK
jgi:hypothetical protein